MAGDEEARSEEQEQEQAPRSDDDQGTQSDDERAPGLEGENKRPDDTLADDKKCPECGEPVDDVRATCINCGYEYKDEDHEDPDAGAEFVTGSQIDDDGNEMPDEEPPPDGESSGERSEESSGS